MLAISLQSEGREGRSQHDADRRTEVPDQAAGRSKPPFVDRLLGLSMARLRQACLPNSYHVPLLSSILGLLYAVRAMEDHHMPLPGTEEYQTSCPAGSRRTTTAVFVKLFAATVTTMGVHGHLSSLKRSTSWKLELCRAIELCTIPLASVFSFVCSVWYGFIDLLALSSGPWTKGLTVRYRFARLCGCFIETRVPPDTGLRYPIGSVAPHHLKTTPLKRDLRWGSRALILIILLAQYSQAAVLMIRRILSDTAAGVDYAMFFLVLSGLTALFQSLVISLLHVSWTLDGDLQSCTELWCNLPGCLAFKKSQGLPCKEFRIMAFGQNIVSVPRTVLHQLAGGFLQCSILLRLEFSVLSNIMLLWVTQKCWQSTIYYAYYTEGFWSLMTKDDPIDSTHSTQDTSNSHATGTLPHPVAQGGQGSSSEPITIFGALAGLALSIVGLAMLAWLCLILTMQLLWLITPWVALYHRIALEAASWKNVDETQPCMQLWKDGLEDELWWF
jgi:hypothetical protein